MSSPYELTGHEKLSSITKRDISNVTRGNSPDDMVHRKCPTQFKRAKNNVPTRKRVTFAIPEDVIGSSPCNAGSKSDLENQIDHHNIWYTSKEYASFLQDRIDNIRVYRSVHGNMAGLEDYYCTTGLEHFLAENGPIMLKQSQLSVISAVLMEQRRQKLLHQSDPESVSRLAGRLSSDAREQAQKRASAHLPSSSKSLLDASEHERCMRSSFFSIGKEILANPMRLVSVPLPSTKRPSNYLSPVDVTTLRQMNLKLLTSFHTKADSVLTNVISDKDAAASLMTLKGMSRTISLSKISQSDNVNSSVLDAMNEALAITDVFSDPECK